MTPERLHWRHPNVSNDNFEQISNIALEFDQIIPAGEIRLICNYGSLHM